MVFHHVLRFFMYQHPAMLPSRSFPWQCRPCHQPTLDLHWLGLQLWLKVPGVASKIGRTWGNELPPPKSFKTRVALEGYQMVSYIVALKLRQHQQQ